jgi:hypothetical protein
VRSVDGRLLVNTVKTALEGGLLGSLAQPPAAALYSASLSSQASKSWQAGEEQTSRQAGGAKGVEIQCHRILSLCKLCVVILR